jgi:hypothetical protein
MVLVFDDLRQHAVRRRTRKPQSVLLEPILVGGVDLVAVAGGAPAAIQFGTKLRSDEPLL